MSAWNSICPEIHLSQVRFRALPLPAAEFSLCSFISGAQESYMEVKSPDLGPGLSCYSPNHQEGSVQVQVTKSCSRQISVGISWAKAEEISPAWILCGFPEHTVIYTALPNRILSLPGQQRSFHHHCNKQRKEDGLNKPKLFWKHFLSYFQIFTFRRWLTWQHKSLSERLIQKGLLILFLPIFTGQRGIPRNFYDQMCPKMVPQNCLISVTKVHEFVE